jgi:hypothetical protein
VKIMSGAPRGRPDAEKPARAPAIGRIVRT